MLAVFSPLGKTALLYEKPVVLTFRPCLLFDFHAGLCKPCCIKPSADCALGHDLLPGLQLLEWVYAGAILITIGKMKKQVFNIADAKPLQFGG